ncbi:MAG TPA: hypothetical protein DCQ98_20740 [Planctomycetaceae bacterium]|nr:hypothetical protein [Planctomycetaceae bacterium]
MTSGGNEGASLSVRRRVRSDGGERIAAREPFVTAERFVRPNEPIGRRQASGERDRTRSSDGNKIRGASERPCVR